MASHAGADPAAAAGERAQGAEMGTSREAPAVRRGVGSDAAGHRRAPRELEREGTTRRRTGGALSAALGNQPVPSRCRVPRLARCGARSSDRILPRTAREAARPGALGPLQGRDSLGALGFGPRTPSTPSLRRLENWLQAPAVEH